MAKLVLNKDSTLLNRADSGASGRTLLERADPGASGKTLLERALRATASFDVSPTRRAPTEATDRGRPETSYLRPTDRQLSEVNRTVKDVSAATPGVNVGCCEEPLLELHSGNRRNSAKTRRSTTAFGLCFLSRNKLIEHLHSHQSVFRQHGSVAYC